MSKDILLDKEVMNGLSPTAQHIAMHKVGEGINEDIFGKLMQDAIDNKLVTKAQFDEFIRPFEEEILQKRLENGERVKTGKGKWLYSKVIPGNSTYRTNKAVIGKALDAKVSLIDDEGKPRGKSALQSSYKAAATKPVKDAWGMSKQHVGALRVLWKELSSVERQTIKQIVDDWDN